MKLDRNINPDGRCKYALINRRKLSNFGNDLLQKKAGRQDITVAVPAEAVETGDKTQFFVLKYGDKFAAAALHAYADAVDKESIALFNAASTDAQYAASNSMKEYALEVRMEAHKAEAGDKIPS